MDNQAANLKAVTHIDNVRLAEDKKSVVIIDQTKLPNTTEYLTLITAEDFYEAIFELKVRGAPAIGICATATQGLLPPPDTARLLGLFFSEKNRA